MPVNLEAYVMNPYALAELVAGTEIPWSRVGDPRDLLEAVLGQPWEVLFDPDRDSLLYIGVRRLPNGTVERLGSRERREAIGRLRFDDERRSLAIERLCVRLAMNPSELTRRFHTTNDAVRSTLTALHGVETTSSETPWTPEGYTWVDKGVFFSEAAEYSDPQQGAVGDCYFIAALSAVAWTMPEFIAQRTRSTGTGQQDFHDVMYFYNANGDKERVGATEKVPVKADGSWAFARSTEPGEIWPAVYEKLYAKWKTGNTTDQPNIMDIAGGGVVHAIADLTGMKIVAHKTADNTPSEIFGFLASNANALTGAVIRPSGAGTYGSNPPLVKPYSDIGVVAGHAYTILGWAMKDNHRYVILRNPWASHEATGVATLSGTWNGITLGKDGVFGITVETFKLYFAGYGWVE